MIRFLRSTSIYTVALILIMSFVLTGCGSKNSEELVTYKENMTKFYDKLSEYDQSINNIDSNADDAKTQLLGYLDEINSAYQEMAGYPIPEQFEGIKDITTEAADYMQKANEFYHQAYDNEFDSDSEQLARQYYQRANSRAMVILQVLHGETPTGEGVTVTEDAQDFSTIGTSSEG